MAFEFYSSLKTNSESGTCLRFVLVSYHPSQICPIERTIKIKRISTISLSLSPSLASHTKATSLASTTVSKIGILHSINSATGAFMNWPAKLNARRQNLLNLCPDKTLARIGHSKCTTGLTEKKTRRTNQTIQWSVAATVASRPAGDI